MDSAHSMHEEPVETSEVVHTDAGGRLEVQATVPVDVIPFDTPGVEDGRTVLVPEVVDSLSAEEREKLRKLAKYRGRLWDLSDQLWEQLLLKIRAGATNASLVREIVNEGLCAHLSPASISIYITRIRELVRTEAEAADDDEHPVEGKDALRRLRWLARIQQARVRKALKLEGMLGGTMLMPQATKEIEMLASILDKEMRLGIVTGESRHLQPERDPEQGSSVGMLTNPAAAMRVVATIERAMKMKAIPETTETDVEPRTPEGE